MRRFLKNSCQLIVLGAAFVCAQAHAQLAPNVRVVSAPSLCPAGTGQSAVNLFPNGDFSNTADTLNGSVPQVAFNTYPPDTSTSIQSGDRLYFNGVVAQRQFPGDPARGIPATATWLYANGNTTGTRDPRPAYRTMRKTVSGLTPGSTYVLFAYVSSAIRPITNPPIDPIMRFVRDPGTGEVVLANFTVLDDQVTPGGNTTTDTWTLVQTTFVPTSTSEVFSLYDAATSNDGDDFAMAQINIRQCQPLVDLTISKTNATPFDPNNPNDATGDTVVSGASVNYTIVVANNGPNAANGAVVRDPVPTSMACNSVVCTPSGGATCVTTPALTVANLQSASGVALNALPSGGRLRFTLSCTIN